MRALTTGQVARLAGVAPRTVAQWHKHGLLAGWTIPVGTGKQKPHRRFAPDIVARFLRQHNVPVPAELRQYL